MNSTTICAMRVLHVLEQVINANSIVLLLCFFDINFVRLLILLFVLLDLHLFRSKSYVDMTIIRWHSNTIWDIKMAIFDHSISYIVRFWLINLFEFFFVFLFNALLFLGERNCVVFDRLWSCVFECKSILLFYFILTRRNLNYFSLVQWLLDKFSQLWT